jgi:hypothetical protein
MADPKPELRINCGDLDKYLELARPNRGGVLVRSVESRPVRGTVLCFVAAFALLPLAAPAHAAVLRGEAT